MKDLLPFVPTGISNLQEKSSREYLDELNLEEDYPQTWIEIADNLASQAKQYEFKEEDEGGFHVAFDCDDALSKALGFDSIMLHAYKGAEFCEFLDSNYIYQPIEDFKFLSIDVYYVDELTNDEIKDCILQELANFKRDIEWVRDGIYEKKMEEMAKWSREFNNVFHDGLPEVDVEKMLKELGDKLTEEDNIKKLKEIVLKELDACGYFISDFDSEVLKRNNPDWKPYSSKSFGEMLLDFAVQYNMEYEGKNYIYRLVDNDKNS